MRALYMVYDTYKRLSVAGRNSCHGQFFCKKNEHLFANINICDILVTGIEHAEDVQDDR